MKQQNIYKGLYDAQSEFDHRFACWANNHGGWAKMKKKNKRLAKKRLRRNMEDENGVNDESVLSRRQLL